MHLPDPFQDFLPGNCAAVAAAAPANRLLQGALAAGCAALILAGCAAPHPAPIVRREPVSPAKTAVEAPAAPPQAVAPSTEAPPPVEGPIVTPVQTGQTPAAPIESRPLPGVASSPGRPLSPIAPVLAGGAVRTEPSAAKQPYSDALLARLRESAPPVAEPGQARNGQTAAADRDGGRTVSSGGPPSAQGFIWPASGPVLQGFSEPKSMGVSIGGKPGDPVVAAADGRVIFSGPGPRGYGNLLIVKHDNDTLSVYAHNRALLAREGTVVKRGQRIAELGDSGTDRPKLHFEIRKQGKPVDPVDYLPAR